MTTTETPDPVAAAVTRLDVAHRRALDLAAANPDSTWIDAAVAIGAALGQLLAAADTAAGDPTPESVSGTCLSLLEAAEESLDEIPPGQGPVGLALVRSYLADAIAETTGREP